MTTVYNPFAARLISRYEELEARYIRGRSSLLAVSSNGLWLRQGDEKGQTVIHALRVSDSGLRLQDVILFIYEGKDNFRGRIDAKARGSGKGKMAPGKGLGHRPGPSSCVLSDTRRENVVNSEPNSRKLCNPRYHRVLGPSGVHWTGGSGRLFGDKT